MEKNIMLVVVFVTLLTIGNGSVVFAENHSHEHENYNDSDKYYKKCKPTPENYEKCGFSDKLDVFITYDKQEGDSYHQVVVSVNQVFREIDLHEFTVNEGLAYIDYYFQGYAPYHSKVCVENLNSDSINCKTVDSDSGEVYIAMPD